MTTPTINVNTKNGLTEEQDLEVARIALALFEAHDPNPDPTKPTGSARIGYTALRDALTLAYLKGMVAATKERNDFFTEQLK